MSSIQVPVRTDPTFNFHFLVVTRCVKEPNHSSADQSTGTRDLQGIFEIFFDYVYLVSLTFFNYCFACHEVCDICLCGYFGKQGCFREALSLIFEYPIVLQLNIAVCL